MRLLLRSLILSMPATFVQALPPRVILQAPVRAPEGTRLEWNASSPELEFTVEVREALAGGGWQPLPGGMWPVTQSQFLDATQTGARFYRVVSAPIAGERGRVISATQVTNLSQLQIQLIFAFGGIPITPQTGVRVYRLIYATVDAQGLRT